MTAGNLYLSNVNVLYCLYLYDFYCQFDDLLLGCLYKIQFVGKTRKPATNNLNLDYLHFGHSTTYTNNTINIITNKESRTDFLRSSQLFNFLIKLKLIYFDVLFLFQ